MPLLFIILLAIVQGLTEFLPVSSSAHLILLPQVTGVQDQGALIDIALHVGTLLAVLVYFRQEIWQMLVGLVRMMQRRRDPGAKLAGVITVATAPVVIAGFLVHVYLGDILRNAEIIAWATVIFAVLLYVADNIGMTVRRIEHLDYGSGLAIGLAQVLALIPGTSRAGITMTAARALGLERRESARFSMLLSIPTIFAAGVLAAVDLWRLGDVRLQIDALVAASFAFAAALLAIALLLRWLERARFTPFVVYRLLLGGGLLIWIYGFGGLSG
ncbi:MAG: undecaprenyl-diphosphate phosphatase [Alphaproteobacteria bacterium]